MNQSRKHTRLRDCVGRLAWILGVAPYRNRRAPTPAVQGRIGHVGGIGSSLAGVTWILGGRLGGGGRVEDFPESGTRSLFAYCCWRRGRAMGELSCF